MRTLTKGSVLSPRGFSAGAAACGIKSGGALDVAVLTTGEPATAAGVFTKNRFAAAPVQWDRAVLPTENLRAVVVNSGNANACTGERGAEDARRTAELAASLRECETRQIALASTGIIGQPLPMERIERGVREAHSALARDESAGRDAERAIMTTDTRPKGVAVEIEIDGKRVRIGGMAKGSGMISPHMATMLAFVTTDLAAPPDYIQEALRKAADKTFNRITVDGDCSTNDTVLLMANGASGVAVSDDGGRKGVFEKALAYVLGYLSREIVRDGEGATKLVEIRVGGAADEAEAELVGRTIADSPLVKCAIHGEDPNWGRIVCAAGYSGAEFEPEDLKLWLGNVCVFDGGLPTEKDATGALRGDEVAIKIELGAGNGSATLWTCDLSKRYVEINAEYHT